MAILCAVAVMALGSHSCASFVRTKGPGHCVHECGVYCGRKVRVVPLLEQSSVLLAYLQQIASVTDIRARRLMYFEDAGPDVAYGAICVHAGVGHEPASVFNGEYRPGDIRFGSLNQSQGRMCICRVLGIGAGVSRECFGP